MIGDQLLATILGANTFGVRDHYHKPEKRAMLGKQKSIVSLKRNFVVTQGASYHKKWEED